MNYTIYRKVRDDNYGGVMVAISNCIPSIYISILDTCCEILWVKLSIPTCKDLYVCAYYRSHISDLDSLVQLNNSFSKLADLIRDPMIWLSGDFNAPSINWQTLSIPPGSPYLSTQQLLLDIIQDHGLSQMVLEPTRSDNILDLFFTSVPTLIEKIQIIPGLSDHDVVVIQTKMRISATKQTNRRIPLYNKANWEAMRNEIEPLEGEINNLVLQTVHIDDVWRKSSDSILHVVNKYIPYKITRKRRSLPWISVQLRKQIKRRDKLYRQAKRSGSADIYSRFLDLKHSIQREMRKSYWQYINSLILPESVGNVREPATEKILVLH